VPLYPLLAAIYLVLGLAAENGSELILLGDIVRPMAGSLAACLVLWVLCAGAVRGISRGAPIALLAVVCFSLFGVLAHVLQRPLSFLGGPVGLLVLLVYILSVAALTLRISGWTFPSGTTNYLNAVTGLLALYSAFRVAQDSSLSDGTALTIPSVQSAAAQPAIKTGGRPPDIFLILLDKYTASRLLAQHYSYDNSPFEDSLRARGFQVPSNAKANYVHTSLALAAMLNLDYLDDVPRRFGVENNQWELLYPLIEDNKLAAFLRGRGFRYVFFPSAFAPTRKSRIADAQIPSPSHIRPEFETVWLWTTPIPTMHAVVCRIAGCVVNSFSYTPESAELLDWKFARLPELAGHDQPVFVFAHLTLPHEPYIYSRTCRHREPYWPLDDAADTLSVKKAYVEQIECLNRKLLVLVDALRERSRIPPVILLQSDHGHGRLGRKAPGLEATTPWQVAERRAIFAAYSLPGLRPGAVSDSISPVNAIRLVLRHYFSADLPPRPEVTYWSGWNRPYRFTRVE
jgi:hypothetical protein